MEPATHIAMQTKYLARFRILISRAFRWHVLKTATARPSYALAANEVVGSHFDGRTCPVGPLYDPLANFDSG